MEGALRYRMDMGGSGKVGSMIAFKVILFTAFLLIALLFAYYNLQEAEIRFLNYSLNMPLFLLVLASFVLGFILAHLSSELRSFGTRKYGEKLRKGLRKRWTGRYTEAETELSKLLDGEEIVPLYVDVLDRLGKEPSLYLEKYNLGIVETVLARRVLRKDPERARNLLEKALGKNWENLEARRLLRSLYFLEGDFEKSIDLQRSLLQDSEKPLKEEERQILASMLSEAKGEGALQEVEKLPLTPSSLALLISSVDQKRRRKYISKMFQLGIQNEVILILTEKNDLSPEIIEAVEENKERFSKAVLAFLYANLGMHERLEDLKEQLPKPIRTFITGGEEDRECLMLWECAECGKDFGRYTPVCGNCLSWNKLKTKGGG